MSPSICKAAGAATLGLSMLALFSPTALAQCEKNSGIVPVHKEVHGKSYGEWGAAWWQWCLAIPWAQNPLNDNTGANAANGQSGPVWFLGGTFGGNATRTITVPYGKHLFFPLINWEWDTVPGFGPYPAKTKVSEPLSVKDAYRLAAFYINACDPRRDLSCTIDGDEVKGLENFRAISPVFSFTYAPDMWGPPYPGPYVEKAVTDGYWLMLKPLARGQHTIRFTAHLDAFPPDGPPPAWQGRPAFDLEVVYHITVQ